LVKQARQDIKAGFALLPDEDFERFIQGLNTLWQLTLPEDFRHKLQELAITVGREYVEDGLDGKTLIAACESYAPTIAKYLELGEWSVDTVRKWIDRLLLPAAAMYALSRLAERTQGLEPKIRKLRTEARQVEKTDPKHAKLIRDQADYLCESFPRGFVPTARKIGRPNLNPWRAKALDLLFEDGAPISQMAKALGQNAASLRRRRKLSRSKIAEALRRPVARRSADPKR
jgi:transposase-like protein